MTKKNVPLLAVVGLALLTYACREVAQPTTMAFAHGWPVVGPKALIPAAVAFRGMHSFAAKPGDFCAVGLGFPTESAAWSTIRSLDSITVKDVTNQQPIAGFSFLSNTATSEAFGELVPGTTWWGFDSGVSQPILAWRRIELVMTLTVLAGTREDRLRARLREGFIGVSQARSDGTLIANAHQDVVSLADLFDQLPVDGLEMGSGSNRPSRE